MQKHVSPISVPYKKHDSLIKVFFLSANYLIYIFIRAKRLFAKIKVSLSQIQGSGPYQLHDKHGMTESEVNSSFAQSHDQHSCVSQVFRGTITAAFCSQVIII